MNIELLDNPQLTKEEISQIVKIHIETFEGFFLTFLGKGFLMQMYEGFVYHEKSGLIVAKMDSQIVGMLAYSEDLSEFYKYLIKTKFLQFAWYAMGAAIRKPTAIFRLLRAFLKPSQSKRKEKYIELSSIGVDPKFKGQHIGSGMIDELKKRFDSSKFEYINLETDAINNDDVNAFYKKNDFILSRTFETSEGRKMNEYRWTE